MGYAKKEKKISMPKGMREKTACQKAWRKEKKKKERNKDSPYFQIKGIHPKEKVSWFKGVPKIFRTRTLWKFHTLACVDQSVWLASPWGLVFDLAKYLMQVCLKFYTYP